MFPEDMVVNNFTSGKDKTRYLVNYGISPWVKDLLRKDVENAKYVVIGFDESLDKATQNCQMNLNVWDPIDHKVKIRNWYSKFLGHSTSTDLLTAFNDATLQDDLSKSLKVSMDGPSFIHLFYKHLGQH